MRRRITREDKLRLRKTYESGKTLAEMGYILNERPLQIKLWIIEVGGTMREVPLHRLEEPLP